MKKEMKTVAEYNTPKCKVVNIHVQNLVCASPYGASGAAGNGFDDDNTTDYSDNDF